MTKEYSLESMIAVDCGSIWTRALLMDVVDGQYRLVARGEALSTIRRPHADATLGVARAIAQIEQHSGRRLLDDKGQPLMPERGDGNGADAFVVTASAARPLRVVVLGITEDVSLSSARRALAGCNLVIADTLSLADRLDHPDGVESALSRLARAEADAIVIVGGTDGASSDRARVLADVAALAQQVADPARRPTVIYAGNAAMASLIVQSFQAQDDVTIVENVRPSMDAENLEPLRSALQALYAESRLQRIPGMGILASWSRSPLIPTLQAQSYVLRYLADHYGLSAINLEYSASSATVSWAHKGGASCVSALAGAASGATDAERSGVSNVLRWLPESREPHEALGMLKNLSLHPGVIPGSPDEISMTLAVAREAFAPVVRKARSNWSSSGASTDPAWDLIILSGAMLTDTANPARAALLALDVLQPVGVSGLVMDAASLMPAAGAIAALEPVAAAQALDQDGFISLGTVIAPRGLPRRAGEIAMSLKFTYADERTLQLDVPAGSLEVIPLAVGQKATLQLKPGRHFDLGWARRTRKTTVEVDGGLLGIIVDARGRPLDMPAETSAAQEKVAQWVREIGA